MRCSKAEKWMAAHAAGELSEARARDLEEHLALCPQCRKSFAVYRESLAALRQLRVRQAPEAVMRNFWPELRRRLPGPAPGLGDRARAWLEPWLTGWVPRTAVVAVAAAAIMLLVWVVFVGGPQKRQTPEAYQARRSVPSGAVSPAAGVEPSAHVPGEVPFTAIARYVRGGPHGRHFFELSPSGLSPRWAPHIDFLNSTSLADRGTAYTLPTARLASMDGE